MTRAAALVALVVACGGPPRAMAARRAPRPLILPHGGGTPASWFDGVRGQGTPPTAYRIADGIHAGLVGFSEQPPWSIFAIHEQHGLIGRVAIPAADVVWFGLGRDDEVLAARADGTLLAAPIDKATSSDAFVERARMPGVRIWDAAGATIVA